MRDKKTSHMQVSFMLMGAVFNIRHFVFLGLVFFQYCLLDI